MEKSGKIYVAGHKGLVGSVLIRHLEKADFKNIIVKTHQELDLIRQSDVEDFFAQEKPDYVFLAAAKVGGINANSRNLAEFYYQNAMIDNNVIHAACENDVKKFLFLGSSCIYPRMAPQPIPESALLSDYLEPTNEGYALAKISALKYCQYLKREKGVNFISVMPTNLYGPNDNFDYETSHVLPALLRKFHDAKQQNLPHVTIWGSGKPLREFLYIDDLADAILFLMENYDEEEHINVGSGEEVSISDLAGIIADVVGYKGQIIYDKTKPDGTPRKLLDVSKLTKLGWKASIPLREGIEMTYNIVKEEF